MAWARRVVTDCKVIYFETRKVLKFIMCASSKVCPKLYSIRLHVPAAITNKPGGGYKVLIILQYYGNGSSKKQSTN